MLATRTIHRLIKDEGAKRISRNAVDELRLVLEGIGSAISYRAIELSKKEKRKTILHRDIINAIK